MKCVVLIFLFLLVGVVWVVVEKEDPLIAPETIVSVASITRWAEQFGVATLEVVDTQATRMQGLSGRSFLERNRGMLFVFETSGRHSFWMKDVPFPLDIAWISEKGKVVHIERFADPASYNKEHPGESESFAPPEPARYVLEVNGGVLAEVEIGSFLK